MKVGITTARATSQGLKTRCLGAETANTADALALMASDWLGLSATGPVAAGIGQRSVR
jgi:hypothetical protein